MVWPRRTAGWPHAPRSQMSRVPRRERDDYASPTQLQDIRDNAASLAEGAMVWPRRTDGVAAGRVPRRERDNYASPTLLKHTGYNAALLSKQFILEFKNIVI